MAQTQIGVQLYTLREHLQTPTDIARSFKKIADMGFTAVQASGLGPIAVDELKKLLDDHGLACAATHVNLEDLRDTNKILDYHRTLDCQLTALGGFHPKRVDQSDWQQFADECNNLTSPLATQGLRVGYHNHSHEWVAFDGPSFKAKRPIDVLADKLDPAVWFEVDTYWVAHAGGDPAAWITYLAGLGEDRLPAIHVKDMAIDAQRTQKMCEVGSGNLNWPAILDAAKKAKVRWYLIERDAGDLDPFESLQVSLRNMQEMGLS